MPSPHFHCLTAGCKMLLVIQCRAGSFVPLSYFQHVSLTLVGARYTNSPDTSLLSLSRFLYPPNFRRRDKSSNSSNANGRAWRFHPCRFAQTHANTQWRPAKMPLHTCLHFAISLDASHSDATGQSCPNAQAKTARHGPFQPKLQLSVRIHVSPDTQKHPPGSHHPASDHHSNPHSLSWFLSGRRRFPVQRRFMLLHCASFHSIPGRLVPHRPSIPLQSLHSGRISPPLSFHTPNPTHKNTRQTAHPPLTCHIPNTNTPIRNRKS
jgi:hypothetical protein